MGVFFYRGDSLGEGGSGDLWLDQKHLEEVCDKLVDGGLIVTDGSNHREDHAIRPLWRYNHKKPPTDDPRELVESIDPFTDKSGRHFTCVGYAGYKYGPTLIWRVRKG